MDILASRIELDVLTDEWKKKMWHIYTMEYYSAVKKEWRNAICSNIDGPRDYHTKWSKSERGQRPYDITYMWNLKYDTNEFIYRHREQTCGCHGGGEVGEGWMGVWA